MRLCIDVGNTTIDVGIFYKNLLKEKFIFNTNNKLTTDELYFSLKQILTDEYLNNINEAVIASVVPSLNTPLVNAINKLVKVKILFINSQINTGLDMMVDNPNEVGADLVADLVSTKEIYGFPSLIADLGTATKLMLLDKNGVFNSCVIIPGLSLGLDAITKTAALLSETALENPTSLKDSKNTNRAIVNGVIYSHIDTLVGMAKRYENELGYPLKLILTGGNAVYVKDLLNNFIYDENLCLTGINDIAELNL
ncbi:MAG: type III pantothenate kinase [Bacilli bacterium]|nr:type III pantothenate kinase [Bacilli bacterium]